MLRAISVVPMTFDVGTVAAMLGITLTVSGDSNELTASFAVLVIACATQALVGLSFGIYRGRAALGSFDEAVLLLASVLVTTATIAVSAQLLLPAATSDVRPGLVVGPASGLVMIMTRVMYRIRQERLLLLRHEVARPTIVVGAGEGGRRVVRQLLHDPRAPFLPVALLDDDPAKRYLRVLGVPVMGRPDDMASVAQRTGAEVVLVAIPSGGRDLLHRLRETCRAAGLDMKIVPSLHELTSGAAKVGDIRDVDIDDVLGRPQSLMDLTDMAAYLRGKRVLVTGAGGSIGSELCRVLSKLEPEEVLMLDRDESALHAVQLSIEGKALLDSTSIILADIRDADTVHRIFAEHRPDVVFHAAALKHLPLLERHPGEAVQTNVWGTWTVMTAAAAAGVERFVNISTDKAADPISVLGWSKRVAERLVAFGCPGMVSVSVRFGNVLGSRGSVLHTFAAQAKAGGPITVTHPEATRYFMTVTESVHLVIAAGGIGRDGDALVLDMGEPANILDVARLVSADDPVPIEFTGLRPGEKLHEQLFARGEAAEPSEHPLITHVAVPPLDPRDALGIDAWSRPEDVVQTLVLLAEQAPEATTTARFVAPGTIGRQRSDSGIAV